MENARKEARSAHFHNSHDNCRNHKGRRCETLAHVQFLVGQFERFDIGLQPANVECARLCLTREIGNVAAEQFFLGFVASFNLFLLLSAPGHSRRAFGWTDLDLGDGDILRVGRLF